MELTGRVKEEFKKWFIETHDLYDSFENELRLMSDTCLNALIIEWFDSVGIYVNVLRYGLSEPNKWVVIRSLCENNLDFIYSSRQEATIRAIKKANDIYNERFK